MPPLRFVLVVLAAILAGLAAAAAAVVLVGGDDGRTAEPGDTAPTESAGGPLVRLSGVEVASGETIGLGRFGDKPIVVTVWASWCTACPRQAEALRRFAASHAEAGFLAVDTQEDAEAARAFLTANGLSLTTIADTDGRLAAKLGVRELPTTLFLTSEHRVVGTWEGPVGLGPLRLGLALAKAGSTL